VHAGLSQWVVDEIITAREIGGLVWAVRAQCCHGGGAATAGCWPGLPDLLEKGVAERFGIRAAAMGLAKGAGWDVAWLALVLGECSQGQDAWGGVAEQGLLCSD